MPRNRAMKKPPAMMTPSRNPAVSRVAPSPARVHKRMIIPAMAREAAIAWRRLSRAAASRIVR